MRSKVILLAALVVTLPILGDVQKPLDPGYEDPFARSRWMYQWIEGFKVYNPVGARADLTVANTRHRLQALEKVREQLRLAVGVLPIDIVNSLQKSTIIMLDNGCVEGGISSGTAFYASDREEGEQGIVYFRCYHFVAVEVTNRSLMLHELAHAWHDQYIADGFDNEKIKAFFELAKSCWDDEGGAQNTYWRTDANEYFAEMSVAYFYLQERDMPVTRYYMDAPSRILVERAWFNPDTVDDLSTNLKCRF